MADSTIPLHVRMGMNTIPEPMSGCHLWIGTVSEDGYGQIGVNGRKDGAHRVAWLLQRGPIPAGKWVLHGCDNPSCVNVLHLHLGDAFDNMREVVIRGRNPNSRKTHCPQGHAYTPENTVLVRGRWSQRRQCRSCNKEMARRVGRKRAGGTKC